MEVAALLIVCWKTIGYVDLQKTLGTPNSEHFRNKYLITAIDAGMIELTIPDEPRNSLQQ